MFIIKKIKRWKRSFVMDYFLNNTKTCTVSVNIISIIIRRPKCYHPLFKNQDDFVKNLSCFTEEIGSNYHKKKKKSLVIDPWDFLTYQREKTLTIIKSLISPA